MSTEIAIYDGDLYPVKSNEDKAKLISGCTARAKAERKPSLLCLHLGNRLEIRRISLTWICTIFLCSLWFW